MAFVLVRLFVTGYNMQQSSLVYGAPSPATIAGFVHSVERDSNIAISSFAEIVHCVSRKIGHRKDRPTTIEAFKKGFSASTLDVFEGDVDLSLILRLTNTESDASCVKTLLRYMNCFGGGRIVAQPRGVFCDSERDLNEALRRLPSGWLLRDRSDVFEGSDDPIETLLNCIGRRRKTNKVHDQSLAVVDDDVISDTLDEVVEQSDGETSDTTDEEAEEPDSALMAEMIRSLTSDENSVMDETDEKTETASTVATSEILVPLHVGYAAIESPKSDRHDLARDPIEDYDHVLAESITSVGQFIFLHSELKKPDALRKCFWSIVPNPDRVIFRVAAV